METISGEGVGIEAGGVMFSLIVTEVVVVGEAEEVIAPVEVAKEAQG